MSNDNAHVFLVGLNSASNKKISRAFESVDVRCQVISQISTALEKIAANPPSLIVTEKPVDIRALQGLNETLRMHAPITPFLVLLKEATAQEAMTMMKVGAYECLPLNVDRYRLLSAAKRATARVGRTLFVHKVVPKKSPITMVSLIFISMLFLSLGLKRVYNGPPRNIMFLGSANLSGIQWQDRELWVGDWFDSTITEYVLQKSFLKNSRELISKNIFKMQDGQPILIANSPDAVYSISADLKIRSHQKSVGLPTLQMKTLPGGAPSGLAWDGEFVWSADAQTNRLYKHGEDLRVLESIPSILSPVQGLTYDGQYFWIAGGSPLKLARLEITKKGRVWQGPYLINQILTEGVMPTGISIGFDRLWLVSGGDPKMMSKKLSDIIKSPTGWTSDTQGKKP